MGDDEGGGNSGDPRYVWLRNTVKQHFSHINEAKFEKTWDNEEQMYVL
jgi:hypothetical protein